MLTEGMQAEFYQDVVCDRHWPARYYSVVSTDEVGYKDENLLAFGGFDPIQWENSLGEITLTVNPQYQGKGYGTKALDLLLEEAFNRLNLDMICGEVYECNIRGWRFWKKAFGAGEWIILPARKFYKGRYWDSAYFCMDVETWQTRYTSSSPTGVTET